MENDVSIEEDEEEGDKTIVVDARSTHNKHVRRGNATSKKNHFPRFNAPSFDPRTKLT